MTGVGPCRRRKMRQAMSCTTTRLLLGAIVAAFLAPAAGAQAPGHRAATPSAGVSPSEANFFIGTPAGWVAPRTAWGDPDLHGTWPISYVGSVPLQRCAG